jgi:dihydroflavonol-4-reductase
VLTSSTVAVVHGHPPTNQPFTEETWTSLTGDTIPYYKSKTLAERAAWDFVSREGGGLELAAINPGGIFGPLLGRQYSESIRIVQLLMDGVAPAGPASEQRESAARARLDAALE